MPAARSGGSADRTRACTALPQGEPAPKIARAVDDPATLAKAAASSEPPWCPGWSADQGVSCHDGLGGPRGEVSGFPGPFPRGLPPNPACTFQCTRLSSDCSVSVAVGCPLWMSVWQGRQTMWTAPGFVEAQPSTGLPSGRHRRALPVGLLELQRGNVPTP